MRSLALLHAQLDGEIRPWLQLAKMQKTGAQIVLYVKEDQTVGKPKITVTPSFIDELDNNLVK